MTVTENVSESCGEVSATLQKDPTSVNLTQRAGKTGFLRWEATRANRCKQKAGGTGANWAPGYSARLFCCIGEHNCMGMLSVCSQSARIYDNQKIIGQGDIFAGFPIFWGDCDRQNCCFYSCLLMC